MAASLSVTVGMSAKDKINTSAITIIIAVRMYQLVSRKKMKKNDSKNTT